MTITEQTEALNSWQGNTRCPEDLKEQWYEKLHSDGDILIRAAYVPFRNPCALYEKLTITRAGRDIAHARCIHPVGSGPFPTIFMFHDIGRKIRGWHHMTRFVACGYAVIALENCNTPDSVRDLNAQILEQNYVAAYATATAALTLPFPDKDHLVTWGEGFGGALAVFTAAMLPGAVRCAALNPMPADFNGECGISIEDETGTLDPVSFASLLKGSLLIGTGLMDKVAPPKAQYAIYNRANCPKRHLVYPKYEHERNNFFENELLKFLHL